MYPRVKRIPHTRFDEVIVKFFDKEQSIEIDKCKCIGCGICLKACPKQILYSPNFEGKIRVNSNDLTPEITNPLDCSFCGTCAYICPTSAIWLKKDNDYVKRKNLGVISKKVVPKLDYELVELENPKTEAKTFIEGQINVDWEKCISCISCVNVCPTNSFTRQEKSEGIKKNTKPLFNPEKCIRCGACERACSQGAITLKIDEIKHSGPYKEIFWFPFLERIKNL